MKKAKKVFVFALVLFALIASLISCKQTSQSKNGGSIVTPPGPTPPTPDPSGDHPAEIEYKVGDISFKLKRIETVKDGVIGSDEKNQDGEFRYEDNREHTVNLSEYYIGETEVTQELYQAVMQKNPSKHKGAKLPVENVSPSDACLFCNKLTALLLKEEDKIYLGSSSNMDYSRKGFRLPTDAEWEWAAQGGKVRNKWAGTSDINKLSDYAWGDANNDQYKPEEVKQKKPNEFGLYDMTGNVDEWCQNSFDDEAESGKTNPALNKFTNEYHGGSYYESCQCAFRNHCGDGFKYTANGFRIVRRLESVPSSSVTINMCRGKYDSLHYFEVEKGISWQKLKEEATKRANARMTSKEATDEWYRDAEKGEVGATLLTDDFIFETKTELYPITREKKVIVTIALKEGETQLTLSQPNTFEAMYTDEWKDFKSLAEEKITIKDPSSYREPLKISIFRGLP